MWRTRTIAAVAAAGLTAAGLTGAAVAVGTQDGPADAAVDTLVEEGAVTAEDAAAFDRVRERLRAEVEERIAERQERRQAHLEEIAATIGISSDDLVERWRDGESLTDIAGEQADEVAALVTRWMQEWVDEFEAAIPERVDTLMDVEGGQWRRSGPHHGFGGGPHHGFGGGPEVGPGAGLGEGFDLGVGEGAGFGQDA